MSKHTIFALATAPAKSGVAIIRVSGELVLSAIKLLSGIAAPSPNHAKLVTLRNPSSGAPIDNALLLYFKAPASFTGEDVAEFHLHGSPAVIREMLMVLGTIDGLRHAEAGEFTRRAFINGKMDLLEAEGLADLINAETSLQKNQALQQVQGHMSFFYNELREKTIRSLALLEAYIDFPDEEIPETVLIDLQNLLAELRSTINKALGDGSRGERLREGLNLVIIGAPNAGKSSLFNLLAKRDVAIVSQHAGTTRDVLELHFDIAGYPVVLMDTAGLRHSSDEIEAEGIRRARLRAAQADIKLALFDASKLPEMDKDTTDLVDNNTIVIFSKSDLLASYEHTKPAILLSTKTGQGIEILFAELEKMVVNFFSTSDTPLITRTRHRILLQEAAQYLDAASALYEKPLELICEDLRKASLAIGKITGKITLDDILDVIFHEFCIGK